MKLSFGSSKGSLLRQRPPPLPSSDSLKPGEADQGPVIYKSPHDLGWRQPRRRTHRRRRRGKSAAGRAVRAAGGAVTAGLCVPAHCPGAHCSRVRDPGRRRKGEEPESAPRETLAQGAFQLCRLQRRPAEAPQRGRRTRPHP